MQARAFSPFCASQFCVFASNGMECGPKMTNETIGGVVHIASYRADRTVIFSMTVPALVNSGRRPIYAMRVESWELRIERERELEL